MEKLKVFEFAKTVGMETMALMDKLRSWHIPVKSHMAELDGDTIQLIRTKLSETKSSAGSEAKKSSTKKAAVKKAPAEKAAAPKAAAPKAGTKTAAKASAAKKAADKKQDAKASNRIIRRKAGSQVAPEVEPELPPIPEIETVEDSLVEATPDVSLTPSAQTLEAQVSPVAPASPVTSTPPPPPATPTRVVRREVVVDPKQGPQGPSNIVGRMDLSRAQAMQRNMRGPQQGGPGGGRPGGSFPPRPGGGPGGGGGFGPRPSGPPGTSRPPNRNFRTGFVAPAPDIFAVMEEAAKRDEKKRRAKAGIAEGVTEKEAEVEQFAATEYRKRELVFQPKKKKTNLGRPSLKTEITKPKASKRVIKIHDKVKVGELAQSMGLKVTQVVTHLMKNGMVVTVNDTIDFDTASLVAPDFGFEIINEKKTVAELSKDVAFGELETETVPRPPVVTVMGHVDHGKTSLLDAIRKADVASGEAGGITQHIGAYNVTLPDGRQVTFIDTPGHEAFTAMRARGANVTDLVILVVAADDGVMKQTQEAIHHAKAASVPIVVAVNKMDKPGANVEKIKQQLTEYELVAEEWGGQTVFVPVSALKKQGLQELLEAVLLQADVLELKANPKRSGTGIVIEAKLDRGRGPVVTLLVKDGTVHKGDFISAGGVYGRVRALIDDHGKQVETVGPGFPVELLGLNSVPNAGDQFDICETEDSAVSLAKARFEAVHGSSVEAPKPKMTLEELFSKVQTGDVKELPIVLKADVAGSLEALKGLLAKLPEDKVKIRLVYTGVGGVSESDVLLASSSKGLVVAFNVRPDGQAESVAKQNGVEIKAYSIIYNVVDDIKKAMEGLLAPQIVEKTMGRAQVRDLFSIPKIGVIAGCSVLDGKIHRSNYVRLIRDSRVIYDGKIGSLRRFKDDAREVAQGFECGIGVENYNDLKVGDVLEAYERQEVASTL